MNYEMELYVRELKRYQSKFGQLCFDSVMDNAISEDELYELIPYVVKYVSETRNIELFKKRLFSHGNIDYPAKIMSRLWKGYLMKKFGLDILVSVQTSMNVMAETREEAMNKAIKLIQVESYDYVDLDNIVDIEITYCSK